MSGVIIKTIGMADTAIPISIEEAKKLVKKGHAKLVEGVIYREIPTALRAKVDKRTKGYKTKVQKAE